MLQSLPATTLTAAVPCASRQLLLGACSRQRSTSPPSRDGVVPREGRSLERPSLESCIALGARSRRRSTSATAPCVALPPASMQSSCVPTVVPSAIPGGRMRSRHSNVPVQFSSRSRTSMRFATLAHPCAKQKNTVAPIMTFWRRLGIDTLESRFALILGPASKDLLFSLTRCLSAIVTVQDPLNYSQIMGGTGL